MIWNNIELFNVSSVETRLDGALNIYRFPAAARAAFVSSKSPYAMSVGTLTTGCEIRFVGKAADIFVSPEQYDGFVEIYRGDFFCRMERLQTGVVKILELRDADSLSAYKPSYQGRFSPDVWRVVFCHDFCGVIHGIRPYGEIRPPHANEVPAKKILAYGSSITHSACSILYTNSYAYNMGKQLGADVLCKGMGGSCHIEKEVADYLCQEEWDVATLELGVNMVECYPVAEFEKRAKYLVEKMIKTGKPVVLISNFTCYHNIPESQYHQANADYVRCLEEIYNSLHCENLYYIRGEEMIKSWDYLTCDLIHPSPYGHGEMARNIAQKLREEFKIL